MGSSEGKWIYIYIYIYKRLENWRRVTLSPKVCSVWQTTCIRVRTFWRRRVCRCAASRIFFFRSSDLRSALPPEPVASEAGCLAGGSSPGSSAGGQSPARNEKAKGPRGCSPGWTSPFCNVPSPIRTVPGSRGGIPSGLGRRAFGA